MQKICLIHTSVSSMSEASILSADLMKTGLTACIQIAGSGLSIYRWKGKIERADEYYLNIKTATENSAAVVNWLQQHHPYELAEVICMNCDATAAYADWVNAGSQGSAAS